MRVDGAPHLGGDAQLLVDRFGRRPALTAASARGAGFCFAILATSPVRGA